jgi:hypothetical protein
MIFRKAGDYFAEAAILGIDSHDIDSPRSLLNANIPENRAKRRKASSQK